MNSKNVILNNLNQFIFWKTFLKLKAKKIEFEAEFLCIKSSVMINLKPKCVYVSFIE